MSKKSTKIIAVAGVVAGLGVAALPAMTFAGSQTISGQADVYAQVLPAIAMTITGNNDDTDGDGTSSQQQYTTDPVTAGVGVSAPAGVAQIGNYIPSSMDITNGKSSSYTSILPNASIHGGTTTGATDFASVITVFTNDSGYTLSISGTGTSNALGALVNTTDNNATIPATGIVKAGEAGWGYAVDTAVTTDATGTPLEANYNVDADTIKDGSGPTAATGESTTVYYGVSTAASQKTGVYKATVTYTATTDN